MRRLIPVAVVLALAGCAGPGGVLPGGDGLAIVKHADVTLRNEDATAHPVTLESRLPAGVVDTLEDRAGANSTVSLRIGIPESGNVRITLATPATGKKAEITLAAQSCKGVTLEASLREGAPSFTQTTCT